MSEFLHMGGYAFYVWTSYGIATLVMAFGVVKPLLQHTQLLRQLQLKRKRGLR
ncbi:MAG: heme exporter protein CcmD [Methylococcaceae bacterium]|nr:heme exporter protein CcmD [Methylococcaceae bacterium]